MTEKEARNKYEVEKAKYSSFMNYLVVNDLFICEECGDVLERDKIDEDGLCLEKCFGNDEDYDLYERCF